MINFEKMREQETVLVFNYGIAEALVYEYGLRSLIGIERSNRTQGKKAFEFINTPRLFEDLKAMIEDVRMQKKERNLKVDKIEADGSTVEKLIKEPMISDIKTEVIKSIDDTDIMGVEEPNMPKKRGRKKKEVEVKELEDNK